MKTAKVSKPDKYESIRIKAREDAKTGTYRVNDYSHADRTQTTPNASRQVYALAYLAAREKMGLIGMAGYGK